MGQIGLSSTSASDQSSVLSLSLNVDSVLGPVSPRVFGIHAQGLYERRHPEGLAVFEAEEGRALLERIEFGMVRFPAGSGSWGYRLYEADGETLAKGLGRYVSGIKDRSNRYPRNALLDLFDFCALTGVTEVSYVYNPLQPIEEAVDVVRRMTAKGLTVVQVELGNEYQQRGKGAGKGKAVYRERFPDAEAYLEWAEASMLAFRESGFTGRFSLVCANALLMEVHDERPSQSPLDYYWDWNKAVEEGIIKAQEQDSADVEIGGTTHQYLHHGINQQREPGEWSEHLDAVLPLLCRDGAAFLDRYVKNYYQPIVPNGVHLTEWAIKWPGFSFGNTLFEAQHVVRFLLDMSRFNIESGYRIQSAFYQKLGGQLCSAMITHTIPDEEGVGKEEHEWRYKGEADYHAFALFQGLVHEAVLMAYAVEGPAKRLIDEHLLRLECFRDAEGRLWVVYANASSQAVDLEGASNNSGLSGPHLLSGVGFNPSNWDGDLMLPPGMEPSARADIEFFTENGGLIPAFSVGRMQLERP